MTLPSGVIEYRHYIAGGAGTAAIHTRRSSGTSSTYYWHSDHLGSPELFTDSAGNALVRPSFGAYGERRDGSDWLGAPSAADLATLAGITRRGFTGHEHLDAVGLIHMNGRVYDPAAGRFLSVDPLIELGNSQSPNSYSYVWNNPLTLIDPSGYQAAPADVVTQGQPSPRNLCPWRIANIGMRCQYQYGWRWDIDPYYRWLIDEYRIEAWVQMRSAQGGLSDQQPGGTSDDAERSEVGGHFSILPDREFWDDFVGNVIQEVVLDPIESAKGTYAACTSGSVGKCAWDVGDLVCEVSKVCDGLKSWEKTFGRVRNIIEESRAARSTKPLLGQNPRTANTRTNTDLPGDRATAKSIFRNQTRGQDVTQTTMPDGTVRRTAADGTQIRMNPDGTTRLDLPGRGPQPNGETIHIPPKP